MFPLFPQRRCRPLFLFIVLVAAGCGGSSAPERSARLQSAQPQQEEWFSVVALPDTQHYSGSYPEIFAAQTAWIAENADAMRIRFVVGLGDVVNHGSSSRQWQNADAALSLLDGKVPFLMAAGNHDYDEDRPALRSTVNFNSVLGPWRFRQYGWYGGGFPAGSNENAYGLFEAAGRKFLVLVLEFTPRRATLDWAASLLAAHPDRDVIVVTHSFMYSDGTRVKRCDEAAAEAYGVGDDHDGNELWEQFLIGQPRVFLVLSGHIVTGKGVGRRVDIGRNGNVVHQVLSNYQSWPQGGKGYLRILSFYPSRKEIKVRTYSPYLQEYLTSPEHELTLEYSRVTAEQGLLQGQVRAPDCGPLAGALVRVNAAGVFSDQEGRLQVTLSPAEYTVEVGKDGYAPRQSRAPVHGGMTTYVDLPLGFADQCRLNSLDPSVTICSPTEGESTGTALRLLAGATNAEPMTVMQVYLDGVKVYEALNTSLLDVPLSVSPGTHRLSVQARTSTGVWVKRSVYFDAK